MDDQRLTDPEIEERLGALDGLLERIERMPGADGEVARDAVAALAEVYGEALARTLAVAGSGAARRLAGDQLVGHLMALHGLHPDPPERRAAQAIAEIQSRLHGGAVELTGIEGGVARVAVTAGGCGSADLPGSVTDIVLGAVPEFAAVETTRPPSAPAFIPLGSLRRPAP